MIDRRVFIRGASWSAISGLSLQEVLAQSMFRIVIVRTYESDKCISGELFANRRFVCHTLELPWRGNKLDVSAIKDGNYRGILRYDKSDKWRIQLRDEDTRPHTGVQIHIGNYTSQTKGCVLTGEIIENSNAQVLQSAVAYAKVKQAFYGTDNPVATPDVAIQIEILHMPKPTEIILRDPDHIFPDNRFVQSGTQWLLFNDRVQGLPVWNEVRRTSSHFEWLGIPKSGQIWQDFAIRIPLRGGGNVEVKSKSGGSWRGWAVGQIIIRNDVTAGQHQ